ncbi:thermonuclease family protein [Neobacillus sp. MER 74]|uniref:thermonuclease family protein n=1 Tax=Neobacillus sp. MER 74 TaxID=2939566 RepID=UPI00203B60AD|nr:thermonuclease family protein [Neobacillus sp. MER 74]MCM3117782.1 thermonuclease family protein [Neobacillus sp. MER 74]
MYKRLYQLIISLLVIIAIILTGCNNSETLKDKNDTGPTSPIKNKEVNTNETSDSSPSQLEVPEQKTAHKKLLPATIVKNVDGDTVEINLNGTVEKVRMLCVDTPETHHPRLGVQPFGPEASEYTKKILAVGTKVEIEPGIGEGRDKYGRLLAYFYVNGKMFNEMLLEEGLARVAYIYAPNTQYVDEFYAIQKKAQKKGIGIWSIENYAQEDGYSTDNTKSADEKKSNPSTSSGKSYENNPNDDQETNLDCKGKIKGNANSHIYHVPGGSFYESTTDNIVWFCSEKEAQDQGYRKSKR